MLLDFKPEHEQYVQTVFGRGYDFGCFRGRLPT